jgi:hypothetical protein
VIDEIGAAEIAIAFLVNVTDLDKEHIIPFVFDKL